MSITMENNREYRIHRVTSGNISECETNRIIDTIRSALSEGTLNHAISLESPLASNIMMMGLLVICEKMVRRVNGELGLIIMTKLDEPGLHALCESLDVRVYDSEEEWRARAVGGVPVPGEEERISYQQLLSDFFHRSKELYHHLLPPEYDFPVTQEKI
jgi:hypothetical protein